MATQEPSIQTKKPRSPVERAIVWGVIGVLLAAVAVELWDRSAFQFDFNALTGAMQESELTNDKSVTESKVKSLVKRYSEYTSEKGLPPNALAANRCDTYRYSGLLRNRVMYVYYGHHKAGEEPDVISVATEKAVSADEYAGKFMGRFDAQAAQAEADKQKRMAEIPSAPSESGKSDAP